MTSSVNSDFDTKLVELVGANPALYANDCRTSPYECMKKKIELWNSIAASMDAEAAYCISRWKSLRDRFRRELVKNKQLHVSSRSARETPWVLYDKLLFLEKHIKYHNRGKLSKRNQHQQHSILWSSMEAENIIEEVLDDDPLQEPMDEQYNFERDRSDVVTSATTTTHLQLIEVLLEGLDDTNRTKAERRIVAYLCKCQLKSLSNEGVDDVVI